MNATGWIAVAVAALAGLIAAGWGLHKLCLKLEAAGYLYYRQRPSGGGGGGLPGVFMEIDRLARPSVQHVVEAQDEAVRKQDDAIGGD